MNDYFHRTLFCLWAKSWVSKIELKSVNNEEDNYYTIYKDWVNQLDRRTQKTDYQLPLQMPN